MRPETNHEFSNLEATGDENHTTSIKNEMITQPCSGCIICPTCYEEFNDPIIYGESDDKKSKEESHTSSEGQTTIRLQQQSMDTTEDGQQQQHVLWNVSNNCNHKFCDDCLVEYCIYTVTALQLVPIPCPLHERHSQKKNGPADLSSEHEICCNSMLSSEIVRQILRPGNDVRPSTDDANGSFDKVQNDTMSITSSEMDESSERTPHNDGNDTRNYANDEADASAQRRQQCWIKYERLFRRQSQQSKLLSDTYDDNTRTATVLVPCPKCDEDVIWTKSIPTIETFDADTATKFVPFIECSNCRNRFCPTHGNAHSEDISCNDYISTPEYKASIQVLQSISKPCSHCNVPIQLVSGTCNHVVCTTCHNDMCYKCGTHVFLNGKGALRTCTKCMVTYRDHRYDRSRRSQICLSLPCIIIASIIWAILSISLAIVSCCYCSICTKEDVWIDRVMFSDEDEDDDSHVDNGALNEFDVEQGTKTYYDNTQNEVGVRGRLRKLMRSMHSILICVLLPVTDVFEAFGIHPFWIER